MITTRISAKQEEQSETLTESNSQAFVPPGTYPLPTRRPALQRKQSDVIQRSQTDLELELGDVEAEPEMTDAQRAKADFSASDLHYVPSGWEQDINIGKAADYLDRIGSIRVKGKKGGRGTPEPVLDGGPYTLTVVAHGRENDRRNVHAEWHGQFTGIQKHKTRAVSKLANRAARIVNRENGTLRRINLYVCFSASNGIMQAFRRAFLRDVDADKMHAEAELIGRTIAVFVDPRYGPSGSGERLERLALS